MLISEVGRISCWYQLVIGAYGTTNASLVFFKAPTHLELKNK